MRYIAPSMPPCDDLHQVRRDEDGRNKETPERGLAVDLRPLRGCEEFLRNQFADHKYRDNHAHPQHDGFDVGGEDADNLANRCLYVVAHA
jgi:hypothetical protein